MYIYSPQNTASLPLSRMASCAPGYLAPAFSTFLFLLEVLRGGYGGMSGGVGMAQRVKGSPWPTGEPCQLELPGRRIVGIDPYPWDGPGGWRWLSGERFGFGGANLGAEGSTHTGHRQGRRLGKRAENNGYADRKSTRLNS